MAKTEFSIRIDYQRALNKAKSLEKIAEDLKTYRKKLNICNSSVNGKWKGDNSTQYQKQLFVISENLNQIIANISDTAATIRRIAKRTYDTEMASLEIAKNRTYH